MQWPGCARSTRTTIAASPSLAQCHATEPSSVTVGVRCRDPCACSPTAFFCRIAKGWTRVPSASGAAAGTAHKLRWDCLHLRSTPKMSASHFDRAMPDALIQSRGGRRLRGSVAQQFAVRILTGGSPEGYVFPGEVELAARIGISRSALREAFRILAAKGLLESQAEDRHPCVPAPAVEPAGSGPAGLAVRIRTETQVPARSVRAAPDRGAWRRGARRQAAQHGAVDEQ